MRPGTAARLAIAIVVTIAGSPASAGAAGWTGIAQISGPDTSADSALPAVSTTSKELFVAWRAATGIEVAVRPPGGAFAVSPLTGPASPDVPAIAVSPDGRAVVAWRASDKIYVADRAPGGAFTVVGAISGSGGVAPVVTIAADGTEVVAWAENGTVNARMKPPGGAFGTTAALYTKTASEAVVSPVAAAADGAGNVLIAHQSISSPPGSYTATVRSNRRAAGAGFAAAQFVASVPLTNQGQTTRVGAFDSIALNFDVAGRALLTTRHSTNEMTATASGYRTVTTNRLQAARREAAVDAGWGGLQEVEQRTFTMPSPDDPPPPTPSGSTLSAPSTTVAPDGSATMVWHVGTTPSVTSIRSATAPPGAAFGPSSEVAASAESATNYRSPFAVAQPDGAVLLVVGHATRFESGLRAAGTGVFGPLTPFTAAAQDLSGTQPRVAGGADGDALASWPVYDSGALKFRQWAAIYDASPPVPTDISVPASATSGTPIAMSAAVSDALSSVRSVSWSFGDGTSSDGTSVSHTYAAAGTYTVALTTTDAVGNVATATRTVTVVAPGSGGPGPGGSAVTPRPVLRSFRISPSRFAVGAKATALSAAARAPRGTKLRYDVSAAGTLRVTIARLLPGRRSGTRCVKPTRKLRTRKRCTRAVTRGTLTRKVATGMGTVAFSGRLGTKALPPGRYRATATEEAPGATARSTPRTATFTIVRR
jgi:hypothetical protein